MMTNKPSDPASLETTTLGGGCFWCLEPVFEDLEGVKEVRVGYAGGWTPSPSYQAVCAGDTGHAEVAQITFDPKVVSFEDILRVFFTIHDPTTLNRQGADVGTQYRSIVLYQDESQRQAAEKAIAEINAVAIWEREIVTEVKLLDAFYPAEDYHKGYYEKNPNAGYCQVVIAPKVAKFRQKYRERLKSR